MAFRLQRLKGDMQIADGAGKPTLTFVRYWQQFAEQIERVITAIADILGITDQLNEAIARAEAAAEVAQGTADNAAREQALVNSYITPSAVVSANEINVFIEDHQRVYGDAAATTVAVDGATVPHGQAPETRAYVSYLDPNREGGAVEYVISEAPPVQTGSTHVVGVVIIPATGTSNGGSGPRPPGSVEPDR